MCGGAECAGAFLLKVEPAPAQSRFGAKVARNIPPFGGFGGQPGAKVGWALQYAQRWFYVRFFVLIFFFRRANFFMGEVWREFPSSFP